MKTCARCKEEYPATIEYFHRRTKSSTGFASYCKKCSSEVAKERKSRKAEIAKEKEKQRKEKEVQVEPPKFYLDKTYTVITKMSNEDKVKREFSGRCIYHDKRLLTLRNKKGITETFLKMDFVTKDYKYMEGII